MNKTKKRGKSKSKSKIKSKSKRKNHTIKSKGGDMGAKIHIFPRFEPGTDKNEMKVMMIPIKDNNPIESSIKNTNDWIAYAFNQYPVIPANVKVQTQTLSASYKKKDDKAQQNTKLEENAVEKVEQKAVEQNTKVEEKKAVEQKAVEQNTKAVEQNTKDEKKVNAANEQNLQQQASKKRKV